MKQAHLKKIRVILSLVFFCLTVLLFLDVNHRIPRAAGEGILYLQFVPSLLKFINVFSLTAAGFIVILVLTLLFGRVFCSTLCPLGTLQDIIIRLSDQFTRPRKVRFRFARPYTKLRYVILAVTMSTLLGGTLLALNLLDPFSNFGRLIADLVRPLVIGVHNLIVHSLEAFDIYGLYPLEWKAPSAATLLFPLFFLAVLIGLAARKGRLYCNTLCPVGTLLGFLSQFAVFKIRIEKDACTVCARCSIDCKASCIRLKTKEIDFSRCVACFDCMAVCPESGIGYKAPAFFKHQGAHRIDGSRRALLSGTVVYLAGLGGFARKTNAQDSILQQDTLQVAQNKAIPVTPPGSRSIERFNRTCSACHLCVSVCPTQVLQPALLDYGLTGILQPRMDYHKSFCNFDCTICTQICPTGALLPLGKESKQTAQLGITQFLRELCIVYKDKTACGACAELCPTKAVHMVPYEQGLTIPQVDATLCIGCGACEYACPVRPERAIYVASNPVHGVAKKPEAEQLQVDVEEDFPF